MPSPVNCTPNVKIDKISASNNLPTVASYNCRSLFPKIESFKTDILERQIDVGFACEIWEKTENKVHRQEIEKMLELSIYQPPDPQLKMVVEPPLLLIVSVFHVRS